MFRKVHWGENKRKKDMKATGCFSRWATVSHHHDQQHQWDEKQKEDTVAGDRSWQEKQQNGPNAIRWRQDEEKKDRMMEKQEKKQWRMCTVAALIKSQRMKRTIRASNKWWQRATWNYCFTNNFALGQVCGTAISTRMTNCAACNHL